MGKQNLGALGFWRIFIMLAGTLLSSCAHLSGSNSSSVSAANEDIRDVSRDARGDNESPRHRILILPFLDERGDGRTKLTEAARQAVTRDLRGTRQLVVVAPEDFPHDPKKYLGEENEYDLVQIAKLASAMGIAAVVEGKVISVKAKRMGDSVGLIRETKAQVATQVRVRVFAGKNGKEVLNEMRSAETEASSRQVGERGENTSLSDDPELARAAIRKAFAGAVPGIIRAVEKLNWEGRVAMVNGERVFVNAGRLSGLQVNDVLKVTEEGDDVYDPDSGRFIGTAPGRLKGTIEVMSYFGKDGAIAVIRSGSGFQENDRVELY